MKISKLLLVGAVATTSLLAHGLWLNSFESISAKGGHVTVGFGTGHNLKIDDAISQRTTFLSFNLTTPQNENIELKMPSKEISDVYKDKNIRIIPSNLAMQKISFNEDSISGTYSISMATKSTFFTKYIDNKGKERFKRVPKDKIKDVKEILSSKKYTKYAKSYFVFKNWTQPKPVGHKLELIPTKDISKLYIGDTITLNVLYKGEALSSGYVTAKNSLSKGDNALYAPIRKGKVKFVLTNFGQWNFNVTQEEKGDITLVNTASATINIK